MGDYILLGIVVMLAVLLGCLVLSRPAPKFPEEPCDGSFPFGLPPVPDSFFNQEPPEGPCPSRRPPVIADLLDREPTNGEGSGRSAPPDWWQEETHHE